MDKVDTRYDKKNNIMWILKDFLFFILQNQPSSSLLDFASYCKSQTDEIDLSPHHFDETFPRFDRDKSISYFSYLENHHGLIWHVKRE